MSLYSRAVSLSTPVPREGDGDIEAEAWVLATEPGQLLMSQIASVPNPRPADIGRWRKLAPSPAVAAAIRLVACQAKARTKFSRAEHMWLTSVGLEQATSEIVARHKARRFESCELVVDLCSGVGGDALALAQSTNLLAVDLDQGMCRRLAWNAAAYGVADRLLACQSRAETMAIPPGAWVHIDPDRRAAPDHRARRLLDYEPAVPFLLELCRRAPGGAIKLSPASNFARHFAGAEFEVELISLAGECKEATIWFGGAVTSQRRATRLPENVTWTDKDAPIEERMVAPIREASVFLYDPDPALLRSGLLDSFALAHGLNRIASDVAYLTGERLVATPFLAAFQVQSVHRLDLKQLRRLVAEQDLGPLEIKIRGVDLTPERLRTQLRARGNRPATLILAGGARAARAIVAQRINDD
jgi:hypothetical protein